MKINGIVLAAGFGKRLMPLTGHLPKPLLPVCGKTMLDTALEALTGAGAQRIAVNTHHLAPLVEQHVKAGRFKDAVSLFHEAEILGTGGPLVNAKMLLSDCDCFLLHNGDILSDFDLKALLKLHVETGSLATMATLEGPENRLLVSKDGKVLDILGRLGVKPPEGSKTLTYAGIAAFSPEIFRFLPERPVFCSIIDAILKAMAETPGRIAAFAPPKPFWSDIGSFEQYFKVHETLLNSTGRVFGEGCKVAPGAKLSGFVAASANCIVESGASVCNCILLDGAKVNAGERRRNEAVGPDFAVHRDHPALSALKILAPLKDWQATSLVEQGSDRRFYRIREPGKPPRALMISSAADKDFQRFLDIGSFLWGNRLMTPELFSCEPSEYAVLMEDLGDDTLYDLIKADTAPERRGELYGKAVDALAEFQARGTEALQRTNFQIRLFDLEYLRWESDYFMENFIKGLCRLQPSPAMTESVTKELDALAACAFALPRTLMHRDFQSQNILLPCGTPRFVDFQGARLGPYVYDIASLTKDPYVMLPKELRDSLLERHHRRLTEQHKPLAGLSLERYKEDFRIASLQRNMQALGAYGFLSLKKRKLKYLAYAEPCLALLLEGLGDGTGDGFDSLRELCNMAKAALSSGINAANAMSGAVVQPCRQE